MKRTATAVWNGDLKSGKGTLSTPNGVLRSTPYSLSARFEDGAGTNPEELVAAAHSGCFTMQLSAFLAEAGFPADELSTTATLTAGPLNGDFTITNIHLDLTGKVPGIEAARFEEIAASAKAKCPVSRLLKTEITLSAKLA